MNRDVLFSMDFFECLRGDSFSAPPLFLFLLFFFFFSREGVEPFLFQSGKVFFLFCFPSFFLSFFLSLDRKGRGLEGGNLSVWEAGGKTFSDIVSVGIPVERVKP